MNKIYIIISCIIFTIISGCIASSQVMNRVSIGMTKNEVIEKIGQPVSVSAKDGYEILNYRLAESLVVEHGTDYYVRLLNGKVESYGRLGDFDSAIPQQKIMIDLKQIDKEQ